MITGPTILDLRKSLGESQTTFGRRFGVDQSTVAGWERKGAPRRGAARILIERLLKECKKGRRGAAA